MKLWKLTNRETLPENDDPWDPWYDKAFGFVVRAETEEDARKIADKNAGGENRGEFMDRRIANTNHPWLYAKYSTCEELTADGEAGMILRDFHAA